MHACRLDGLKWCMHTTSQKGNGNKMLNPFIDGDAQQAPSLPQRKFISRAGKSHKNQEYISTFKSLLYKIPFLHHAFLLGPTIVHAWSFGYSSFIDCLFLQWLLEHF